MFNLRRGFREDVQDFINLFLLLAHYFPEVFGKKIVYVLGKLFLKRNHFSYEHTVFVEFNGGRAGMLSGYGWKRSWVRMFALIS